MKTTQLLVALILFSGLLITTQSAEAACNPAKVTLTINKFGIWYKPDNGPKCIPVDTTTTGPFEYTIPIRLLTPGPYELRTGQVHVRQAIAKEDNGMSLDCSSDLSFKDPEYTNSDEDDIQVIVVGDVSDVGQSICYEIVIDDIGMLDPRATVEDHVPMRGQLADDLYGVIEAYNLLMGTTLATSLGSVPLDDFLQDTYGKSLDEALAYIREYGK